MLNMTKAIQSWSVNDIAAARKFYSATLGLDVTEGEMGVLEVHTGEGATIWVYPKPNHEPATFTVLNFPVDNVEQTVDDLISAGVVFEQYHGDGLDTDKKGIMHGDGQHGPTIAWFKDPSGNIMSIVQN